MMRIFSSLLCFFLLFNLPSVIAVEEAEQQAKQKIIALAPHVVEMLFELGVGDQIIATTAHADYPEAALSIPQVGNYARIQIEQVLSYQPDLIIAWRTGNPSDDVERLVQLGLNVVYSDPKKITDIAKELRWLGGLTQRQDKAEQLASDFERRLAKVERMYRGKKPLTVFYELWSDPLTTVANNAWPQQAISLCQTENVFKATLGDYPQVGFEQIVLADPQIVIQPRSDTQNYVNQIDWSKWQQIRAGKHNKVIYLISDVMHRMTPRFIMGLEKLCADIDLARQYYQTLAID